MSKRGAWNERRFAVRERQRGMCWRCRAPLTYAGFCVVAEAATGHDVLVALCRPCCTRHFAPIRLAVARARRGRNQTTLALKETA